MKYLEQGFHIEDLFELIFPADVGDCGHLAMIFYGYLDDSSDRYQERVVVSGSLIGTRDDWTKFRKLWTAKLKEHGIAYYKTAEWRGLRGEFRRFQSERNYPKPLGREAADEIRAELEEIVENSRIGGVGVVIPVPVFAEVSSIPELKEKLGPTNAYQLALQTIFVRSVDQMNTVPGNHKIAFVHDDGSDCDLLEATYRAFKRKNPRSAKYVVGFSCLDDKLHPPLQGADMVANTTCNYARQWQENPTEASLGRLKESILEMKVWDRNFMMKIIKKQRRTC